MAAPNEDDSFAALQTQLMGEKVLQAPRVSRETLISVLKSHTSLIQSLKKDFSKLSYKVQNVDLDNKENKERMNVITTDLEANKKSVSDLFRLNDGFRKEMDELSEKVAELYLLKKHMNEQQEVIESLSMRYNKFSAEVSGFIGGVGDSMERVEMSNRDSQFQLKELKDYVDHFADNLVLSSSQITVEVEAGFAPKAQSLTDTLAQAKDSISAMETDANHKTAKIESIIVDLDTKAPDSVLFNVNTLERKVSTIEMHLRKEEEQGIGAIRKTCEELGASVQSMAMEISEKIDRESVGFIVHEKYEEIVRYLQDALQSSLEDENKFRAKADEIQEMVILLTNSKADRSEIQHMQELMVKSEALLKKVGGQMNIKERLKDFINRKELDSYMDMKVDKLEFEQQVQALLSSTKRNRKLSSLTNSGAPSVDDALDQLKGFNNMRRPMASTRGMAAPMMQPYDTSDDGIGPSAFSGAVSRGGDGDSRLQHFNGPPGTTAGLSSTGGLGFVASSAMPRVDRAYAGAVPVMAVGRSLNPNSPSRGGSPDNISEAGRGARGPGADFASFVRGKGKPMAASASLPAGAIPGTFRLATEGGKAGAPPGSGTGNFGGVVPVPVMRQQTNDKGQPMFGANGAPMMTQQLDVTGQLVYQVPHGGMMNAVGQALLAKPDPETGIPVFTPMSEDFDAQGAPATEPLMQALMRARLDEAGRQVLDAQGRPVMEALLDSNGEPIFHCQQGLVNRQGQANRQKRDATGTPMFVDGRPVMETLAAAGLVPLMRIRVDGRGKPILNSHGAPVMVQVFDARGFPLYKDAQGVAVDAQGTPMQQQMDAAGRPMFDSEGAPIMLPVEMEWGEAPSNAENVQGSVPDHTSHIYGPVVGGGFNMHKKHMKHKIPGANTVPDTDVEGRGLMLQGKDGKLYYQDLSFAPQ